MKLLFFVALIFGVNYVASGHEKGHIHPKGKRPPHIDPHEGIDVDSLVDSGNKQACNMHSTNFDDQERIDAALIRCAHVCSNLHKGYNHAECEFHVNGSGRCICGMKYFIY